MFRRSFGEGLPNNVFVFSFQGLVQLVFVSIKTSVNNDFSTMVFVQPCCFSIRGCFAGDVFCLPVEFSIRVVSNF